MPATVADVPALANLWDAEKNELPAERALSRGHRAAWWRCDEGHSFQRSPRVLSRKIECPTCALSGSSFADAYPALAKRWHPSKNGMTPFAVSASHHGSVWWICEEGHTFERSPLQMAADQGCPHCAL